MRNGFRQTFAETLAIAHSSPAGDCRSYSEGQRRFDHPIAAV